jgi:hypothetical protein
MERIILNKKNDETIIKPIYLYKVFKLTNIEVLGKGDTSNLDIYYRYSQDYGRSVTDFIPFTSENIISERINPIRFFQIEYLLRYTGTSEATIFDINLIGDFQNVTLDGQKTNVYGIRANCNCLIAGLICDPSSLPEDLPPGGVSSMLSANYTTESTNLPSLNAEQLANLYNPYQQSQALTLFNKMSNDVSNLFGHEVIYILTDPDQNGTDHTFHEYTIQNYVCDAKLKVNVDNNQFPENTGAINNFDLSLFDTFEINITKDAFKAVFGIERRPGLNDVLWFCNINKIYTVEHAQAIRNFNNYAVYYKLILKKFNQKANIIGATPEIQNVLDNLTKNTTLEELMGLENMQDKKATANQEQLRPSNKAQETLRVDIAASIEQEVIQNASVTVAKTCYEMSTVAFNSPGVVYRNFKFFYQKSDNIGFSCWFNINQIDMFNPYQFFNYMDTENNGFIFYLLGNSFYVDINGSLYEMSMVDADCKNADTNSNVLSESTWYALVININQRLNALELYLYKRNVDYEDDAESLTSSKLRQVYKYAQGIVPTTIDITPNTNAAILGSNIKITNLRLFNDVIPETSHNKLLNLNLIGTDYKYVIFVDNANQDANMPFNTDSRINYNKIRRGTGLDR